MQTCKLTKKTLSHLLLHAFCIHFLRMHHDYLFTITISFRKYKRKVVTYLFNNDSSKSTFFMLSMAFDVLLSKVFVKLIWNSSFLAMSRLQGDPALCFHMYSFVKTLLFFIMVTIIFYSVLTSV